LDWGAVKKTLAVGHDDAGDSDTSHVDEASVLSDYSLEKLDPTQRVFADRVLKWAGKVADVYDKVRSDGELRTVPLLRSFLGGSAGSGKSTTLKTIVQHTRLMFKKRIGAVDFAS
jgi:pantothenate kinase-related protein Tda10